MGNLFKNLRDRIRNLFTLGTLKKRDNQKITTETDFCRTVEGKEFFPYGFISRAESGRVIVLSQGGNSGSYILLPVHLVEGSPEIKDGDTAIWAKDGGMVVVRKSGEVELNGSNFGGVVKADELKTQLDKMTTRIDGIINAIKTAAVTPTDGGATFKSNMIAVLSTLQNKEDFSNIKNDKVQHGNG